MEQLFRTSSQSSWISFNGNSSIPCFSLRSFSDVLRRSFWTKSKLYERNILSFSKSSSQKREPLCSSLNKVKCGNKTLSSLKAHIWNLLAENIRLTKSLCKFKNSRFCQFRCVIFTVVKNPPQNLVQCLMYFQFEFELHCNVRISLEWVQWSHYSLVDINSLLLYKTFSGESIFPLRVLIFWIIVT